MKNSFKLMLSVFFILAAQLSFAQDKTVNGTVTSESDGMPLPGVSVIVKGSSTGAQTDFDGKYSLRVSAGDILVFSFLGMKEIELTVENPNTYNVVMTEDAASLDEVIVVAYGSQGKKKLASSVVSIDTENIETIPIGSFDQVLQGQAAGVQVFSGSGQPGTSARVRIRGNGSINGSNAPLYIVDGIQISAGDFASLNAADFDTVSVLKDAAAVAPYGSRGANGVILITTKKGVFDQKTTFEYRTQLGVTQVGDAPFEMMNSSELLNFQRLVGSGLGDGKTDEEIAELAQVNTDWSDIFFRTGFTQSHEMRVSGGDAKSRFYTSVSYFDQEGIIDRSNLQRMTLRTNFENKVSDKTKFGVNSSIGFSKSNFIDSENGIALQNPAAAVYLAAPYQSLYNDDGSFQVGNGFVGGNAYENLIKNGNARNQLKIIANGYFETEIVKNITARGDLGVDYTDNNGISFTDPNTHFGRSVTPGSEGSYGESNSYNARITATAKLGYTNVFNDVHAFDIGLFTEYYKQHFRSSSLAGYGINEKLVGYPAGITDGTPENELIPVVGGSVVNRGLFSAFALANYDYDSRFGVSASLRRDASSKFSDDNQWGTFYSLAARWNVSNENFMTNVNFVDDIKFRASYGTTGNQAAVADYAAETVYGQISYGGVVGLAAARIGNPDLKWETSNQFNVGLDFALFDYKLTGTVEYYNNKTTDLFVDYTLSQMSGFDQINSNSGSMRNAGIDFEIDLAVLRSKSIDGLNVNLYGNLNYNKNEILDLGQVNEFEQGTSIIRKGLPLGSHYVVGWAGVNPANGEPLYYDVDGNVTNVFSSSNSTANWGSFNPEYTGGFGLRANFKGFDFSTLFTFADEYYRFNNQTFFQENHNFAQFNLSTIMNTMWKQPGDVTEIQSNLYPRQFSSKDIEDASFTKWRNINVGYTLPKKYIDSINFLESLRIYGQVQNIKTWTNFTGFDPEDDNNIAGYEYPMPTIYTLGLDIKF